MSTAIETIASAAVQDILFQDGVDVDRIHFGKQKLPNGITSRDLVAQLMARKKAALKLPLWHRTRGVVYPPPLNLEQCSSEAAAIFKSTRIQGERGADLTMGFGVDSFFLSKNTSMVSVEQDENLIAIARHNHALLNSGSIQYVQGTAEEFVAQCRENLDFIYIDPSRRKGNKKFFDFTDSSPDVVEMMPQLFRLTPRVIVKASPLMDVQKGMRSLRHVQRVIAVGIGNECRELLFFLEKKAQDEPVIEAVELSRSGIVSSGFSFTIREEEEANVKYVDAGQFLYEPYTVLLKAGCFRLLSPRYRVGKLAPSSHLYASEELVAEFPGRKFRVLEVVKPDRALRARFPDGRANVLVRNHPQSAEALRKQIGLKEGGDRYLIASKNQKGVIAFVAERLSGSM